MRFWMAADFNDPIDDLFDALKDDDEATRISSKTRDHPT